MIHIQRAVDSWLMAVEVLPPGSLVKSVDEVAMLSEAKATNPNVNTCLRHWYDPDQVFGGGVQENKQRARAFFATFIDGTFRQHAANVDFIEEWNEYLATSQTEEEIIDRLIWAAAVAEVWAMEYRIQPDFEHIRLVLGNTAVGNDIDHRFAAIASQYDCLIGYHPYTHWTTNQNGPVRSEGDWQYLSGRWATMDADYRQRGYTVDWLFTEAGPYEGANDGWRSPACLAGSESAYLDAVRLWIQDVKTTDAYQSGRVYGFALFTTGRAGNVWRYYWTEQPELNALAAMVQTEWTPPPPEPPQPPPCRGEPRVQYQRVYNVIHPSATDEQAAEIFVRAWRRARETTGGSFDDAGIGDLDNRLVRMYGIPEDQQDEYRGFYAEYYPGVQVYFANYPIDAPPPEPDITDMVPYLPTHPTLTYSTRPLTDITHIVIHHTTGGPFQATENIAAYHISRGWPGIGYHYLIDGLGRIEMVNYPETVSYHVGGENHYSLGISLKGNFTTAPPPPAQLDAAQALVDYLKDTLAINEVKGHKEMPGQSTACPGATWPGGWVIT